MKDDRYLMESEEETLRLELKTDIKAAEKQAIWANQGECATLINPEGQVVFTKCYP